MKVVVAMSGGVDSSVAAALLKEASYQVIGATMQIWPRDKNGANTPDSCCGLNAIEDARRVAYKLGIPHYVLNFRDIFAQKVIANFCQEYSLGRTPNPCIRCNQYIKFGALLERARELGADFIATGHHARVETDGATGIHYLKRGLDRNKDQSYFLYSLTQEQLNHTLMPIGDFTKGRIREIASRLGLPTANKPGSRDICFIPDDGYPNFLMEYIPRTAEPGPILDTQGKVLGKHRGILFYTIGQRHGLGISIKEPRYVLTIEPERNAIVVGSKEETYGNGLIASGLNWITVTKLDGPVTVKAKIRYRHPEAEAEVTTINEDRVHVKFKEPQMAITPGQAIVFYRGDVVMGGGTISEPKSYARERRKSAKREVAECLNCPN